MNVRTYMKNKSCYVILYVAKLAEKHAIPMHPRLSKAPSEMSVLIPLLEVNSKPSVLFTKRSIHLKSHRGEVCFPGGRMEKGESIEQSSSRRTTSLHKT
ncbi:hypothetical protein COOONC_14092 [Cooperia oncophora]